MESNTHKLIHSFGALADLGQEVADTGDFMEMVRTSLHLLLGTLAIRRGAIIECPVHLLPEDKSKPACRLGVGENYQPRFDVADSDTEAFSMHRIGSLFCSSSKVQGPKSTESDLENEVSTVRGSEWVENRRAIAVSRRWFLIVTPSELQRQEIELIIPMVVHGDLTGLARLGGKASGEAFTADDLEIIKSNGPSHRRRHSYAPPAWRK